MSPPIRTRAARMVEAVREIRRTRGESITPLELWNAIATEHLFRVPSLELADAHLRKAAPGVGTYCYLFTWESPAFGGALGSCHAIDLPFVFGTVHNPVVQNFSGGGDDAFALSASIRAGVDGLREGRFAGGHAADGLAPGSPVVAGARARGVVELGTRPPPDHRARSLARVALALHAGRRTAQRGGIGGRHAPRPPVARDRRSDRRGRNLRPRGRSPTGRGKALKPPPVRVRLPPSPR